MPKMSECFRSFKLASLACFFVFLMDRLSKYLILDNLYCGQQINLLPFLNIVHVRNKGITFGLLSGFLSSEILFLLSLSVLIIFIYWLFKNQNFLLPGSLIIGGALGNLFDRFYYASVIDFLDFYVYNYHWPAFNIADSGVVIGVFLILLHEYLLKEVECV